MLTETGTILPKDISIIIPVKDNQTGIERLLSSFFETQKPEQYPGELIIVDNNSSVLLTVPGEFHRYGLYIQVYTCKKPGPAAARNFGAKHAKGQWLLFVDSDCIPTESMIAGYLAQDGLAVGYQGFVAALGNDYVSRYYESQQIHQPPYKVSAGGKRVPKYLVTANTLINKEVFHLIDGFDETFKIPGGEDTELAVRLSKVGSLAFAVESKVLHQFDDGFWGLVTRFVKYGKGNRLVQKKLKIPLYPLPFTAKNKGVWVNHFLAIVQWSCLLLGFTLKSLELLTTKNSGHD